MGITTETLLFTQNSLCTHNTANNTQLILDKSHTTHKRAYCGQNSPVRQEDTANQHV